MRQFDGPKDREHLFAYKGNIFTTLTPTDCSQKSASVAHLRG